MGSKSGADEPKLAEGISPMEPTSAAALVCSIGLIPSASFGDRAPLFEPIHGSAPSLAGTDSANPIGSILSATMMLRDAFGLSLEEIGRASCRERGEIAVVDV